MSELISGKEALIALANGEEVDYRVKNGIWVLVNDDWRIREFDQDHCEFRLKPRTITINGIEVPAPFDAFNTGENESFWYLSDEYKTGYSCNMTNSFLGNPHLGAWRTEEEIKQVVAALRSVFGKNDLGDRHERFRAD